jgi:selenocysteine-specific elongation factor
VQKEELRSQSFGSFNPRLFHHVLDELTKEGEVVQEQESVRLKDHQVTLAQDQEKARGKIEEIYQKGGLQPPYFKELKDKLGIDTGKEVLGLLVNKGLLIKVKEDLYFHQQPLEDLKNRLIDFLSNNNEITTPQFKEMTGASRKYTIPLLEYFDKTQLTVRVGDSRVLRKR